jgi:hypothetical protein
MNRLAKRIGLLMVGCSVSLGATASAQEPPQSAAPEAAKPANQGAALERRLTDPSVKGAMQHIGSALIASGRDATREVSRNALGEWYWAFHADVRLDAESREAAEEEFDDAFELLATTMADRKIDSLMMAGVDDVATPRCMRWYFLSLDPAGPAIFSVVVYQSKEKPRLRELRILTDSAEVEQTMNRIEHPVGDQVFTIQLAPPQVPAPPAAADETAAPQR